MNFGWIIRSLKTNLDDLLDNWKIIRHRISKGLISKGLVSCMFNSLSRIPTLKLMGVSFPTAPQDLTQGCGCHNTDE